MPKKPMSREFRNRLMRDAALFFLSAAVVLLVLVHVLQRKQFLIVALLIVPATSLAFNLTLRRRYAAQMNGKR